MLKTMPPVGQSDWVGVHPDIREIIETGSANFTDWRYLPENQNMGKGIPKGLINAAEALRRVCLEYVLLEE